MAAAEATALAYFTINEETTGDFLDLDGVDGTKCGVYPQGAHQLGYYPARYADDGTELMTFTDARTGAPEDFEIIARVGCSHDNKPFARIMRNVNTGVFNVVFQPLVLAGSEDEFTTQLSNVDGKIQKRKIKDRDFNLYSTKTLLHWFFSNDDSDAANDVSCDKTAAKLVWVVRSLFDREPVNLRGDQNVSATDVLIKRGDYRMLLDWKYPTCVNMQGGPGASTGGMMQFIDEVLQNYNAAGVIFSGYSLGSGLATAASLIYAERRPSFPIGLVTCCGEAATNTAGVNVISGYPLTTLNVVVNGDDVSGISGPWVQPGPVLGVNFSGKSVGTQNRRLAMLPRYTTPKTEGQFYTIVIESALGPKSKAVMRGVLHAAAAGGTGYTVGGPVGLVAAVFGLVAGIVDKPSIEKNFKNLHLAAEDLVPLILFEKMMNRIRGDDSDFQRQKDALARYGIVLSTPLDNSAYCEWYDNTSFAMRYGICPLRFCRLVKDPLDPTKMRCIHRGITMQVDLPIGGEDKTKKRGIGEDLPKGREKPSVEPGYLRRLTGYDLTILKDAEAAYIAAMNNLKVKNTVIGDIVKHQNVKFLGSILVTRPELLDAAKKVNEDVLSIQQGVAFLARFRGHEGPPLAFTLGGVTPPNTSHHASFIWLP